MSLRYVDDLWKMRVWCVLLWQYSFDTVLDSAFGRDANQVSRATPTLTICKHFAICQMAQRSFVKHVSHIFP